MVSLIPIHTTKFTKPHTFFSFLTFPTTPFNFFVLKTRKYGVLDVLENKKMNSLKFLDKHSVFCCCCDKGSVSKELDLELEAEILAFMEKSENPNAFPSKQELEKAGRFDLVECIMKKGGWYSFGWDEEEELTGQENVKEMDFDIQELQRKVEKYQESGDFLRGNQDSGFEASSSGRSLEAEVEENGGIEGILNRLEKDRISSLGINTCKYGYGAKYSSRDNTDDKSFGTAITEDRTDHGKNGSLSTGSPKKGNLSDSGGELNYEYTPDMWRTWSMQRAGSQVTDFEAGEIVYSKRPDVGQTESSRDDVCTITENSYEASERWKNNHNDIRTHLQHLELELSSTLRSLRSKNQEFSSKEVVDRSPIELQKLSDAWEFQENEIMNAQARLRSTRAKLAILEGRMALALIDAEKLLEEKQKRIDGASKALELLRITQIVWHNSASEVLLTGSFDGWTAQRKMEKSRSGIFTVSLMLYPGRYEIKFLVDGIWKVDPLRPVVNNNGYENNLLIVT